MTCNPNQTQTKKSGYNSNTELFSVNNITNINQMQGLFSNAVIADDAFENTVIAKYGATKSHMEQQNPQGARGYETAYGESRVGIRANEQTGTWREDANGGRYELKTGQLFTLILYAEPKGENQNTEYRLYIETTASNAGLRMQPGQKMVVDGIEFTCHKTDVENVYYYSFQLENDRTVAVNMEYFYANGSTPGGGMRYWTTITERGVEEEHYIAPTEKPVETWWNTERQEYEIEKNASVGNLDIKTRDSYIWFNEAPAWRITVNRDEMIAGGTHGKDVVTQYIITDKITLPEGVSWNPAFIEAIKNKKLGMYYTTNRDMYRYMVEENGVKNMAFELVLQANHSLRNGYRSDILVDDENNVILRYIYQNSSSTKEVEPFTMDVSIQVPDTQKVKFTKDTAPFVFNIPEEAPEKLDIDNEVQLELQYNYSESKKLQAEDEISVNLPQGKLEISKRDTSDSKGNIAYSQYSKQVPYEITIYNNSSQSADVSQKEPGENWVVDVLHPGYIIRDTDMEKMFFEDAYGEHLVIEIANATFVTDMSAYRTVKNTDGEDTRLIPANENAEVVKKEVKISRTGDQYVISVDGTETTCERGKLSETLHDLGYAIVNSNDTIYTVKWNLYGIKQKFSGFEQIVLDVRQRSRSTFERDTPDTIPYRFIYNREVIRNQASFYDGTQIQTADPGRNIQYSYESIISLYTRNLTQNVTEYKKAGIEANIGDVFQNRIQYQDRESVLETIPIEAFIEGSQMAMAEVAKNTHLADSGLSVKEFKGKKYYIFDKAGTYHNVTMGFVAGGARQDTLNADTIIVEPDKQTVIKWYVSKEPLKDKSGSISFMSTFQPAEQVEPGKTYQTNMYVYMNERKNDHLSDIIGNIPLTLIHADKVIYTPDNEMPDIPEKGQTDRHSNLKGGEEVTYRLQIWNMTSVPITIDAEKKMYDMLPDTKGKFAWIKNENVSLRAVMGTNNSTDARMTDLSNNWNVVNDGGYRIFWDKGENFTLGGDDVLYIFVTLKFPKEEEYVEYVRALEGKLINNMFWFDYRNSRVTHNLVAPTTAKLIKGVYDTGIIKGTTSFEYVSIEDNYAYTDRGMNESYVVYYVSIVNDGDGMLYLPEYIVDTIPKGLNFAGFIHEQTNKFWRLGNSTDMNVTHRYLSGADDISVVGATISHRIKGDSVEMTISNVGGHSSHTGNAQYSKEMNKYYLKPKQSIQFAYLCRVEDGAKHHETATNIVTMDINPQENNVTLSERNYTGVRDNYDENPTYDNYQFQSKVTVKKGKIIPGITKNLSSFTLDGGAVIEGDSNLPSNAVPKWKVRVSNNGTQAMKGFTVTDIVDSPYMFDDEIRVKTQDAFGNVRNFKVRLNDNVRKNGGSYLSTTMSDTEIHAEIRKIGDREQLTLQITPARHSSIYSGACYLTPDSTWEFEYTTSNKTGNFKNAVYINSASLYPINQEFSKIGNGILVQDSHTGEYKGVTASDAINVYTGIATSAKKRVTEENHTDNTAVSTDETPYIILGNETGNANEFYYTLDVNAPVTQGLSKLVLIDTLPYVGDHNPFSENIMRGSEFKVRFSDNPEFEVKYILEDGTERVLDNHEYFLEFNEKTSMTEQDWKGSGNGENWVSSLDAQLHQTLRLTIRGESNDTIPTGSTVRMTFKARADKNAIAGGIAWNSFGYHYFTRMGSGTSGELELEAMPNVVGVKTRAIPSISKKVSYEGGLPYTSEETQTFSFLIHRGGRKSDYTSFENWSPGTDVWILRVEVEPGKNMSNALVLSENVMAGANYTLTNPATGEFTKSANEFEWTQGSTYTIVEIANIGNEQTVKPIFFTADFDYTFGSIGGSDINAYTFTFYPEKQENIIANNLVADEKPELPMSGGRGVYPYMIAGIALVLSSLIGRFIYVNRRYL